MPKRDWLSFIPAIETGYAPWLHDHGSLTRRIQKRCRVFDVHNLHAGLSMANRDEIGLLHLSRPQQVYTRNVFLYADNKPVVFAHSVVAAHPLHHAWHALQHLGNRPLGALLFSHPLVQRAPLHYKSLKPEHPLYRQAVGVMAIKPQRLWARRSVFTLHGASLLVTEVFLPDILKLELSKVDR
ncbi:MAG TPA: chorismate lyase [Gallionellaceae bacterium]|nr:chorismate lyase [Gallionellaceae bacterium]